jgi:hypothetical protein
MFELNKLFINYVNKMEIVIDDIFILINLKKTEIEKGNNNNCEILLKPYILEQFFQVLNGLNISNLIEIIIIVNTSEEVYYGEIIILEINKVLTNKFLKVSLMNYLEFLSNLQTRKCKLNSKSILVTSMKNKYKLNFFESVLEITGMFNLSTVKLKNVIRNSDITNYSEETKINDKFYLKFELLSQTTELLKYLIEELSRNYFNSIKDSLVFYTSNAKKVIYLLEQEEKDKNYRKREIVVSCNKILYYSLTNIIEEAFLNNFSLSSYIKYLDFSLFLQRSPEFYFNSKELSNELMNLFQQSSVKVIDSFNLLDYLYRRSHQIKKLMNLLRNYDNKNIIVKIPNSVTIIIPKINKKILYSFKYKQAIRIIRKGAIIKEDYSGNHNMKILKANIIERRCKKNKFKFNQKIINLLKNYYQANTKIIVQELVPKDYILYKVYYLNNKVKLVQRNSLNHNNIINNSKLKKIILEPQILFTQYSFKTQESYNYEESKEDNFNIFDENLKRFFEDFSQQISNENDISLFNLDFMVKKKSKIDTYNSNTSIIVYLIEINYFPSYHEYGDSLKNEFNEHILNKINKNNT